MNLFCYDARPTQNTLGGYHVLFGISNSLHAAHYLMKAALK